MSEDSPTNGDIHDEHGNRRIFIDGYWIRYYEPPEESPANHRALIISLTRRAFHHTEAGINTPGRNLDAARTAHAQEDDPERKRVNAAMLAGALFNRATDIFTSVVDLDRRGVTLARDDGLMRECSACFVEAMELGKQVRHYSGEEGIDELWGEPCKAFTMTIADFYTQRYLKIAQTMRSIDKILAAMREAFVVEAGCDELDPLLTTFSAAACEHTETSKGDLEFFKIWPRFVAASEAIDQFEPAHRDTNWRDVKPHYHFCLKLLREGRDLITYMAGARVPMPVSSRNYLATLQRFIRESAQPLRDARPD
ncbi:MAG: hypothetical protein AAF499_02450 [Pseudomonadota bacterium]